MSEEFTDEAVAEVVKHGYAKLPDGGLLMGMPASDFADLEFTPIGYQGPAQHTYTNACDGFHEPGQCPRADRIHVVDDGQTYFAGEPYDAKPFAGQPYDQQPRTEGL